MEQRHEGFTRNYNLSIFFHLLISSLWLLSTVHVAENQNYATSRPPILNIGRFCQGHSWFNRKQHKLCTIHTPLIPYAKEGAIEGINECRYIFRRHKWNCPVNNITAVFGNTRLKTKNAEMAFLQAIVSAGIMFSVTRACESGDVDSCGCDTRYPRENPTTGNWTWGGCSDNIRWGHFFARDFVDIAKDKFASTDIMANHNYEAGRRVIKDNMFRKCKCFGVSASCATTVCWRSMPKFREIGQILRNKHQQSFHVKYSKNTKKLRTIEERRRLTKSDLVYLVASPNYCEPNKKHGSIGTHGRLCNKTSEGFDGCPTMCCGRGYNTMEREKTENCRCRFHWCCEVECEICQRTERLHICN